MVETGYHTMEIYDFDHQAYHTIQKYITQLAIDIRTDC